ncbi:MAG: hypothetical protein KF862_07255 [Chitinophagaceae bacterium]|nr:hypothetical protein [Chitinophagaceae bacterium]
MARPKKVTAPNEAEELKLSVSPDTEQKPEQKTTFRVPDFDYRDLTGDKFKEYKEFEGKLRLDGHYDFVLLKVNPVFVERYPGMRDSPKDFVGVRAKTDIPEHTTRILLSQAINYNEQIYNAASLSNGKYYLLKR